MYIKYMMLVLGVLVILMVYASYRRKRIIKKRMDAITVGSVYYTYVKGHNAIVGVLSITEYFVLVVYVDKDGNVNERMLCKEAFAYLASPYSKIGTTETCAHEREYETSKDDYNKITQYMSEVYKLAIR